MSLHDVDKGSDNRLEPAVNASDILANRKAHATDSIAMRAQGAASSGKITTKNDQIIASDGTVNRIILGKLPDGTFGLAISKPGIDVSTAF